MKKVTRTASRRTVGLTRRNSKKKAAASYHHGNLRAALIEVGLEALREVEWQELSLRDLARKVGVSANAVYRHFSGKETFMASLAEEGWRRLTVAQIKAASESSRPDTRVRLTGVAYIQFALDNPALFRLMFARYTNTQVNPDVEKAIKDNLQNILNLMSELGGLEPESESVVQNVLLSWSIVHGFSHLALGGQLGYLGKDIQKMMDAVVNIETPLLLKNRK